MAEDTTKETKEVKETKEASKLQDVLIETVRIQLAALEAGITFWSGWVESASKFAVAADQELLKIIQRGDEANDAIGHLTDLSREFLRKTTELPNQAVAEFNARLEKESKPKPKSTRAAKVKP
jgi:hypothetical protein